MSGHSQATIVLESPRPLPEVSSLASLLLPSFGAIVFAVALLEVLFLSNGPQALFRDSDTGWHIRNGEAILRTTAVPRRDSFSYTRNGDTWLSWEWLSDVTFAATQSISGLNGVALLTGITIAITIW